jgi:hypothetical protein
LSGKLPMAMSGIDEALLAYDPEMNGVFIFSEKHGTPHDWFMSFKEMAFWPISLPSNMRPVAVCRVLDGGIEKSLLHGKDGEWRMFHKEQETDDGVALKSHVVIGPFRVSARDDLDGILAEVRP